MEFLRLQFRAMPPYLAMATLSAFLLLEVESLLARRHAFRNTSTKWRASRLEAWSRSRLAWKTGIVRLLRSLVLLSFYDHPEVARVLVLAPDGPKGGDHAGWPADSAPR